MTTRPESGPIGNTDSSQRGRGIPPEGRPGSGKGKSGGRESDRAVGDADVEGYGIGGR